MMRIKGQWFAGICVSVVPVFLTQASEPVVPLSQVLACLFCEQQFFSMQSVDVHKLVHKDQHGYACIICGKNCKENLKRHIRTHTGEKPYACLVCHKKFRISTSLNRHMRIHTNVKPFQCIICCKKFRQSAHLKRHILVVHMREHPNHQEQTHHALQERSLPNIPELPLPDLPELPDLLAEV